MTMTVSRLGQVNAAGDALALFLKVFSGEVLTAFETKSIMRERHRIRTISQGKSASFAVTGKVGSGYHTPGNQITGLQVYHNEKIIAIDGLLISHTFIDNLDEAMNHYDARSIYATEMGRKLAKDFDIHVQREVVKVARASANVPDGFGGSQILNDKFKIGAGGAVDATEKAKELAIALFASAQTFDEKDVDDGERFAAFRPNEYYTLAQNTDLINKLWGGAGAYADGKIFRVAGIEILKSNNVPSDDSTVADTFHGVDATKTVGMVWTPDAVGTVKLLDLAMETEYKIDYQGTLSVAKYAMGHGGLRPECAIELALNTLTN